jgi:hypothetical protein
MPKTKPFLSFLRQHAIVFSGLALLILVTGSGWIFWNETTPPPILRCKRNAPAGQSPTDLVPGSPLLSPPQPDQVVPSIHFTPVDFASRPGFSLSTPADVNQWGQTLQATWYLDWDIQLTRNYEKPEHWQMVRLFPGCISPSLDYIRWVAMHYPGNVWIIGNEPDVVLQDAIPPEEYARDYHSLYQLIKTSDPSARIAVAGVAQGTPLRLAYLDRVLETYQASYAAPMPVDWWTLHGYVLREESGSWGVGIPPGLSATQGRLYEIEDHSDLTLFKKQITDFRAWMKARGYQNTPLALTEFGILMPADYGFPPEVVGQYLQDTFQWLASASDPLTGLPQDNFHLVQRWAWFSLADVIFPTADLADLNNQRLTRVGEAFQDFMLNMKH